MNNTQHTPLDKATRAILMLYAEAFAGSNNKEFVVELYEDARLLEKAAPAMYEALKGMVLMYDSLNKSNKHDGACSCYHCQARAALAQAEGKP